MNYGLKQEPDLVDGMILIDPVSVLLSHADVCRNFVYTGPRSAPLLFLRYLGSSEISCAELLHRHFCWHEHAMWLEDIPARIYADRKCIVMLGGEDPILNATAARDYLLGRIDVLSREYDILVAEVAQQHLDLASLQAPRTSYPLIGLVIAYIRPVWWMVGGGWWVGGAWVGGWWVGGRW